MKQYQLLLTVACLSVIFVLFSGVCFAIEPDDARVTPIWSNETPDRGTSVTLRVFYINDYVDPVTIQRVGVHLDWMEEDAFAGQDLSDEPVTIQSSSGDYFPPIVVSIPQDVSYGAHTYFISVQFVDETYWDSPTKTLEIQSADGTNDGGNGGTDGGDQPDILLIAVGVAAVAVVAVLIVAIIFRRKK
jgi:hypothetical protein